MKPKQIKALQALPIFCIVLFISGKRNFNLSNVTNNIILALLLIFSVLVLALSWKYKTTDNKKGTFWLLVASIIATGLIFFLNLQK
jgi:RsiW-degrading membrane proteinase PrsW (M82 family)